MKKITSEQRLAGWLLAVVALCAPAEGLARSVDQSEQPVDQVSGPHSHYQRRTMAPDTGANDFRQALAIVLNRMMQSYQQATKEAIRIDIVDVNSPQVRRFLGAGMPSMAAPVLSSSPLALSYRRNIKINGHPTASCLLEYDNSTRAEMLDGYESSRLFTRRDIIYYLAAHEFGHCMADQEVAMGRISDLSREEHETLADKVAIAFFLVNGFPDAAQGIAVFNRRLVLNPLHRHPEALETFLSDTRGTFAILGSDKVRSQFRNMRDIFYLALGQSDPLNPDGH